MVTCCDTPVPDKPFKCSERPEEKITIVRKEGDKYLLSDGMWATYNPEKHGFECILPPFPRQ